MSAPSDLIVNRGLKNIFRLMPGFGVCVDQGIASLGALNKAAGGVAKTAVIVHELGEFGTGTAKLLAGKLPSIGIEAKEVIGHDNPTRNFDNIALRIRSLAPDIVMMSNYQNEYVLLARTLYQQKVNVAGFFSILGGGFNYKFVKEMPDVSQYMMDVNHWYNPEERAGAGAQEAGRGGRRAVHLRGLSRLHRRSMLLADSLERAGSADKEKLTAALASSTFKAELMPYGPTKFVNGQNEGARPGGHAVAQGRHRGDRARGIRLGQGGVPASRSSPEGVLDPQIIFAGVLNGLLAGGIYVLVAVGLTLIYGVLHIINFAHGSLLMLAMYAVFFLWRLLGVDPYVALPLVIAGAFVFGFVLYRAGDRPLQPRPRREHPADHARPLDRDRQCRPAVLRRRHPDDRRALCRRLRRDRRGLPAAAQDHLVRRVAADLRRRSASTWPGATPARRSAPSPRSARARGWSASMSTTSSPSPTASASPAWAPRRAC